uniref:Transmembrane protein n=1 Tax=Abalone asfa-like virus TaxID=2839893 RepID=A0A5K7Y7T5_9VIRU|nr:hypothetical protein [Abalone asfa-like virus]BCY04555.1 hypothetical protein [Abalone asfa-like virus]
MAGAAVMTAQKMLPLIQAAAPVIEAAAPKIIDGIQSGAKGLVNLGSSAINKFQNLVKRKTGGDDDDEEHTKLHDMMTPYVIGGGVEEEFEREGMIEFSQDIKGGGEENQKNSTLSKKLNIVLLFLAIISLCIIFIIHRIIYAPVVRIFVNFFVLSLFIGGVVYIKWYQ